MTASIRSLALSSKVQRTVGAGFARGLLEFAVAEGARRDDLLAASGVDRADLADQDGRVPFDGYVALMRAAKDLTGDPALALHYGEHVDISQVSIVGLIGQASETMLDALMQLNRYVRLVVEADGAGAERFQVVRERGGVWMVDTRRNPNDFPELTESAFAQLVCGPRRFVSMAFVKSVEVTHPRPEHAAEYERIFQAPVTFGSDRNAIQFEPAFADLPVARLPRYAFGVLTQHADALLESLESSKSTRGRVEAILMPILHKGEACMDLVASKMALSRQTLFRKLKAEGVTFEQVLDELRHRLAKDYLSARKVSVNETAYLVGFSDPAAFSRAFKRWTGMNPSEIRAHAA